LKWSTKAGRSAGSFGLLMPKKLEGLALPDVSRAGSIGLGLDGAMDVPPGVKAGAAALGLKSDAFALNLVETAEVGVWMLDR
jgi:hypothetical protein